MWFLNILLAFARSAVTAAAFKQALSLVREAAILFADNPTRRAWAVQELIKHCGVSENTARLVVELAVHRLKPELKTEAT